MAGSTVLKSDLEKQVSDFEEMCVEVVAEIDGCNNNRVDQQQCLDNIREKIEGVYGDSLTEDVDEYLGISSSDKDEDEDEDEDEDDDY